MFELAGTLGKGAGKKGWCRKVLSEHGCFYHRTLSSSKAKVIFTPQNHTTYNRNIEIKTQPFWLFGQYGKSWYHHNVARRCFPFPRSNAFVFDGAWAQLIWDIFPWWAMEGVLWQRCSLKRWVHGLMQSWTLKGPQISCTRECSLNCLVCLCIIWIKKISTWRMQCSIVSVASAQMMFLRSTYTSPVGPKRLNRCNRLNKISKYNIVFLEGELSQFILISHAARLGFAGVQAGCSKRSKSTLVGNHRKLHIKRWCKLYTSTYSILYTSRSPPSQPAVF